MFELAQISTFDHNNVNGTNRQGEWNDSNGIKLSLYHFGGSGGHLGRLLHSRARAGRHHLALPRHRVSEAVGCYPRARAAFFEVCGGDGGWPPPSSLASHIVKCQHDGLSPAPSCPRPPPLASHIVPCQHDGLSPAPSRPPPSSTPNIHCTRDQTFTRTDPVGWSPGLCFPPPPQVHAPQPRRDGQG
jgi:hypothetical protein